MPALVRSGNTLAARLILKDIHVSPEFSNILITELAKPVASEIDTNAIVVKYGADNTKSSGVDLSPSIVYLWLGDFNAVGEHSGESGGSNDEILAWERARPGWRNSAGFKRVLLKIGVLEYWREHGFPPQCRAVGANDFACDEIKP